MKLASFKVFELLVNFVLRLLGNDTHRELAIFKAEPVRMLLQARGVCVRVRAVIDLHVNLS